MKLSVVVPTLNGRDRLAASLDSLAEHAPEAEVIVVNGPSADGTTGMVRERDDVDVLVEISARCINVARNAGVEAASGDAIALLGFDLRIGPAWHAAIEDGLAEADVVTGPVKTSVRAGHLADVHEERTIAGRHVAYFHGTNVAFRGTVLRELLDGFDEYLATGGARDAAHRLAGAGKHVLWRDEMAVSDEFQTDGAGDDEERDANGPTPRGPDEDTRAWKYRALSYRLVKNYGLRPTVIRRTFSHAISDAREAAHGVVGGEGTPSAWFGSGRDVVVGLGKGFPQGLAARARDRSPTRNPNGLSKRDDRAVALYDWR
jgi:glycosyltransferase involved in cell wall biosynthesis